LEGERAFSHVDDHGAAHMVDVSSKPATWRQATARCVVRTRADLERLFAGEPGGTDVVLQAKLAGVHAARQVDRIVPLCHTVGVTDVSVDIAPTKGSLTKGSIDVSCRAAVFERTGVEIEALTACTFAALSLVAALRKTDPHAFVDELALWSKSGGRSGTWLRRAVPERP
jgi:cyclic pyranopterin monophosphate synthase